jgi:hypothetical protein
MVELGQADGGVSPNVNIIVALGFGGDGGSEVSGVG